jgi:hypothetical protein
MAEEVRIWRIQSGNKLQELQRSKLDLEQRLEDWLDEDISVLSDDFLVIDRQTQTAFGGLIDLLCLNKKGDVVIVELKRDKTPREVTAQVLDYASWVKDLSREKILDLADKYLNKKGHSLEEAFRKRFEADLPEVLNGSHSMLVVASEIDDSSERIIKYLSDEYGISINVATFQYFRTNDGEELLARLFLIEPSQVEYKTQTKGASKRKPNLTYEELQEIAKDNGVTHLYQRLVTGLDKHFGKQTTASSLAFTGTINGSRNTIFSLVPPKSSSDEGLHFQVYFQRFMDYCNLDSEKTFELLPEKREDWKFSLLAGPEYSGYAGFFKDEKEAEKFLAGLQHVTKR